MGQIRESEIMEGVNNLALDPDAVPRLEDVNNFLCPLTVSKPRPSADTCRVYLLTVSAP